MSTSAPENVVRRLTLADAVLARLRDQIPAASSTPPTTGYLSKPVDVPRLDGEGHVQRYWVLHPFHGTPSPEQDLADTAVDLDWPFQVTVAAATPRACIELATLVDAALYRWTPLVTGMVCGRCHPPDGYDPGLPREDTTVTPSRYVLPLQFRTTTTRS